MDSVVHGVTNSRTRLSDSLNGDADIEKDFHTRASGRKERVKSMERAAWKRIHYHT